MRLEETRDAEGEGGRGGGGIGKQKNRYEKTGCTARKSSHGDDCKKNKTKDAPRESSRLFLLLTQQPLKMSKRGLQLLLRALREPILLLKESRRPLLCPGGADHGSLKPLVRLAHGSLAPVVQSVRVLLEALSHPGEILSTRRRVCCRRPAGPSESLRLFAALFELSHCRLALVDCGAEPIRELCSFDRPRAICILQTSKRRLFTLRGGFSSGRCIAHLLREISSGGGEPCLLFRDAPGEGRKLFFSGAAATVCGFEVVFEGCVARGAGGWGVRVGRPINPTFPRSTKPHLRPPTRDR